MLKIAEKWKVFVLKIAETQFQVKFSLWIKVGESSRPMKGKYVKAASENNIFVLS